MNTQDHSGNSDPEIPSCRVVGMDDNLYVHECGCMTVKPDPCGYAGSEQEAEDLLRNSSAEATTQNLPEDTRYSEVANIPRLGLATTRELLAELVARTEVDGSADYKTVGDE